jgi:hypothetical protein
MSLSGKEQERSGKSLFLADNPADITTVAYHDTTHVKENKPGCPALQPGEPDMEPPISMPDEDLFQQDTEQWLRDYMTDWDDKRIEEELRRIRLMSLVAFYESAMEVLRPYPDLLKKLPKVLPAIPHNQTP